MTWWQWTLIGLAAWIATAFAFIAFLYGASAHTRRRHAAIEDELQQMVKERRAMGRM